MTQEIVDVIPPEEIPFLQSYIGWMYTEEYKRSFHAICLIAPARTEKLDSTIRDKLITGQPLKFMREVFQTDKTEKHYIRKLERYIKKEWEGGGG